MKFIHTVMFALCASALAPLAAISQTAYSLDEASEEAMIAALTPMPKNRAIVVRRAEYPMLLVFDSDSMEISPPVRQYLDKLGRSLNSEKLAPYKFAIEGHADPRGNEEKNRRLSQLRAESVVDYLASAHKISKARLKPLGKGSSELLNTAQPDAPENRRVTVRTLVNN